MLREVTVATRLVLIYNPNNPTSTALPLSEISDFLDRVPDHVCVILDEAYCEFNLLDDPDASIDLLSRHPNLVLLRTFSKVYGLCGLRIGFALCGSEGLVLALNQVRQPFFCNSLAQAAAVEALAHQDAVTNRVTLTIAERISVGERLGEFGLHVADSQANLCWISLVSADSEGMEASAVEEEVMRGLLERKVLVRAGSALGKPGALRVTYGTSEENLCFLEALEEILTERRRDVPVARRSVASRLARYLR